MPAQVPKPRYLDKHYLPGFLVAGCRPDYLPEPKYLSPTAWISLACLACQDFQSPISCGPTYLSPGTEPIYVAFPRSRCVVIFWVLRIAPNRQNCENWPSKRRNQDVVVPQACRLTNERRPSCQNTNYSMHTNKSGEEVLRAHRTVRELRVVP